MPPISHIFNLQVRDTPGVLVRVAQVFGRRGCNITSLHVEPNADGTWSTMTIAAHNVPHPAQIQLQLEKLIDVGSAALKTITKESNS
ncbi:MAG TPA: ACT domain-containing protein [Candidatus Saccharimonadia bacterium]|nr:ACT domain-containing protein [Candidatus Saccharimonadia bacterium]